MTRDRGIKTGGNLFVVSAPSGAGKTTLCRQLVAADTRLKHIVSHTTRKPRPGEVNDRDYTFISEEKFLRMAEEKKFAEWAVVHGNRYGTAMERIESVLAGGDDVLMDIDVQGARQIRERGLDAIFVFILPPSMEALSERLRGRGSDMEDVILARLEKARDEIRCHGEYGYLIVNDDLEEALAGLKSIVAAARLRTAHIDPSWMDRFLG